MKGKQADIRYGGIDHNGTTSDWITPAKLKREIYDIWNIEFDPCPYPKPDWDGLKIDWQRRCFVNPPYGKSTAKWISKALKEMELGHTDTVVFLIHARTDTKWFQDLVIKKAQELLFIRGRVSFVSPSGKSEPSPFPSLIVVYQNPPLTDFTILEGWNQNDPAHPIMNPAEEEASQEILFDPKPNPTTESEAREE